MKPAREPAPSTQPLKALSIPEKRPWNFARSPLLVGSGRKKADGDQRPAFPSEPSPGPCLLFLCARVRHSPDSLTIELPTALAESDAR